MTREISTNLKSSAAQGSIHKLPRQKLLNWQSYSKLYFKPLPLYRYFSALTKKSMRNLYRTFIYLAWLSPIISVGACAEQSPPVSQPLEAVPLKAQPQAHSTPADFPLASNSEALPSEWKTLSHEQWRKVLGIEKCDIDIDIDTHEKESRYRYFVDLAPAFKALLIACDQGAYQDAYRIFIVNENKATVAPVSIKTPDSEQTNTLIQPDLVWGNVFYETGSENIELTYLSAGSGACGYRALYPLDEFVNLSEPKPRSIFADTDCYNGVLVEQWPEIFFDK
ncbi:MAG: hypothetical protein ACI9Y1_002147 [Lentisphaeria bacterium]